MLRIPPYMAGLIAVLVAGCFDSGGSLDGTIPARGEVDRTELVLGPTDPGMPVEASVRLRNTGEGVVNARITLVPGDAPFFIARRDVSADGFGTDIPVQLLSFEPGTFQATLRIQTSGDEPQTFVVALTGIVDPPPDCNDHNPCTLDLVDGDNCVHTPMHGPCNDGNACTEGDACVDGQCLGSAKDCRDGVDCTADACDPTSGCVNIPRAEACSDGNSCTTDLCVPAVGCTNLTSPDGTLCGAPTCASLPVCIGGDCNDLAAPDGFPCEDGDPCTIGDMCQTGECQAGIGEPLGVGDPIVVAATREGPHLTAMRPVELAGMKANGGGVVRVAWRAAPEGSETCPDGRCDPSVAGCDPELRATHGGFVVVVTDVDEEGTVRNELELTAPVSSDAAVAARAVPIDEGLVVAVQFRSRSACCGTGPCLTLAVKRRSALYFIRADATVQGPLVIDDLFEQDGDLPANVLPLAVGADGRAVVVASARSTAEGTSLLLTHAVIGNEGLAVLGQWPLLIGARSLHDVGVALHGSRATTVWRQNEPPQPEPVLACVLPDDERGEAWTWQAPLDDLSAGTLRRVFSEGPVNGVSVAAGVSGPAFFTSQPVVTQGSCECQGDAGCAACDACTRTERFFLEQSDGTSALFEDSDPDGGRAITRVGSGAAFGRVVGVALRSGGGLTLVSPAGGGMQQMIAEVQPPEDLPVRLLPSSTPAVAQDGLGAWLGALLGVDLPFLQMRVVAVIPAGCGLEPQGTIRGLQIPDGGMPDAGDGDAAQPDGSEPDAGSDAGSGVVLVEGADGGWGDASTPD